MEPMLSLRDSSDPSFVGESQAGAVILVALDRWSAPWYKEIPPDVGRSAFDRCTVFGHPVSGGRGDRLPANLKPGSSCLFPERGRLKHAQLSRAREEI